ncbi:MAG: exo-beta-N-acetylmuramidase NamZ domain-containing protein [Pyrinomonadaceae bacterium]
MEEKTLKSGRKIVLGIEKLCEERVDLIKGRRVGLVCNQASVDHELRHSADVLKSVEGVQLKSLFGPQHGIRGDVQDNMIETPHTRDAETGLPVYSLYSETREPTEEMLEDVDVLVCDLQDVGCRIYTFVYTIANCMRVARRLDKRVIVCDRPNPIGGLAVEGNLLESGFESFVGQFQLPTRHGMTAGELCKMFNEHWSIGCDLEVLTMDGWSRELWFDETDAPWVLPSPNMPTLDSATIFPGTVHLEGTQISEGRGTTRPFELVGAPYIEAGHFARRLESEGLPGVRFRATNFQPTFQKHAGATCGGVQIHVLDRLELRTVITGLAVVKTCFELYGEDFRWKEPPYEYVFDKNPFDVISGTDRLRLSIERGDSLEELERSWRTELLRFEETRQKYLMY